MISQMQSAHPPPTPPAHREAARSQAGLERLVCPRLSHGVALDKSRPSLGLHLSQGGCWLVWWGRKSQCPPPLGSSPGLTSNQNSVRQATRRKRPNATGICTWGSIERGPQDPRAVLSRRGVVWDVRGGKALPGHREARSVHKCVLGRLCRRDPERTSVQRALLGPSCPSHLVHVKL